MFESNQFDNEDLFYLIYQTGPVTHLSISHNEDWIAFSSKNGLVYVVRRRSSILPVIPETQISYEHEGNGITSLKWDFQNTQLFIGDDTGRVSVLNLHYIIVSIITILGFNK